MSYILEALKRADAERERGAVPTLRSHGTPAATVTTGRPAGRLWIAALAAVVVVLLAVLAWTLLRQPAPVAVVAQVPAVVPAPVIAVPPTPAEPPRAATTAPPRPAAATVQKATAPTARASAAAATRATPALPAVSAAPAAPAAPAAQAAAATRIFSVAELPEDVRQQLPKLAINGGTYSTQAAYRMLIVNGQVLHENDEPAPGVTLETIRPKDVVLRFKGYRYSLGY